VKKFIFIMIVMTAVVIIGHFYSFTYENNREPSFELSSSQEHLVELLETETFILGDIYGTGIAEEIADILSKEYNLNFKVKHLDDYDGIVSALKNEEIDIAFDYINGSNLIDKSLLYSSPYIANVYAQYFNPEISNPLSFEKTIYCRNEIMRDILIGMGVPYDNIIVDSNIDEIVELILVTENSFYFSYDIESPIFLSKGLSVKIDYDSLEYLPMRFLTFDQKNSTLNLELMNLVHDIYTSKEFRVELKRRMASLNDDAKIEFLQDIKSKLFLNDSYKVFFNDLYPLAYHESGRWQGVYVDLVAEFFNGMGLDYEIINPDKDLDEDEYVKKLFKSEIDLIAPLGIIESRKNKVNFADSKYQVDIVFIKRDGYLGDYNRFDEMQNEKIGIFNMGVDYGLPTSLMPGKNFAVYDSYLDLFRALNKKEVNYVVCSLMYYEQYVSKHNDYGLVIDEKISPLGSVDASFGFNKTRNGAILEEAFSFWLVDEKISHHIEGFNERLSPFQHFKNREILVRTLFLLVAASIGFVALSFLSMSRFDGLTKVKNRAAFNYDFRKVIPQGKTLLYIDLNKFKLINDTYGHSSGDLVLIKFAEKSKKYKGLSMYRIGGDEFLIVTDLSKVKYRLDDLISDFREVVVTNVENNFSFRVTASIGHIYTNRPLKVHLTLEYVDFAMYRSKSGSSVIVDVNERLIAEIEEERKAIARITKVFEKQELKIRFNPIINLKTKEVETFVATHYWNNGDKLEKIKNKIGFIKQIGLIERFDEINLNSLIGSYNQLIQSSEYVNQTFTCSMSQESLERNVKNIIGESDVIDSFFTQQLMIKVDSNPRLSKISIALLQEFSKRGVLVEVDDLRVDESLYDLINSVEKFFVVIDKKDLVKSTQQYLKFNDMVNKIDSVRNNGALVVVTGVNTRLDFAKIAQFDVDCISGNYITEELENKELGEFLESKKYIDLLSTRKNIRK